MKKKIFGIQALVLAAGMTLPLFAGCRERVSNDPDTLQVYVANFGYGTEWLNELADLFVEQDWVQAAHPGITALNRDIVRSGHMAASLMLKLIDGEDVGVVEEPPYVLKVRESTSPAPDDRQA